MPRQYADHPPLAAVFNVGCGVDTAYQPVGDSYGLPFPYLLCVSNRKPHKNEFRVVEAFSKARLDAEICLVFTGNATPDLDHWIKRQQLQSRVKFVGMVPEEKLPSLYRGARALIFPSLYEGFGLPVLEAMACGTPVVTSNVTALPEIAADAALLVDPISVEQIARAMEQIVTDSSFRLRLYENGLSRIARFSWINTSAEVRKIVAEVQLNKI